MNCKQCGAILNNDDLFCKQCGQPINNNSQENSISNNISYQKQTNREENVNYSSNNTQTNQYNNYNSQYAQNTNTGKIIFVIVLIIVFWIVGFFLGKLMFGKNNDSIENKSLSSDIESSSSIINTDNKEQSSSNTYNSTNSSYIITDNNKKITFEIANTLKIDNEYSDNIHKCLEKTNRNDDFAIWIREEYGTKDEYMQDLNEQAENKKSNSDYSNVQLSEIKITTINGKKFYYRVCDYSIGNSQYKDAYFVYEIEEDSIYTVEVEGYDFLTNEEINGVLNINILK